MKTSADLLKHLERREVQELALVSGRLPCVRVGTTFEPIGEAAITADDILVLLMSLGGSRYVENLGTSPKLWTSRHAVLGIVNINAVMTRDGNVQARFAVEPREEAKPVEPERPGSRKKSVPPPTAMEAKSENKGAGLTGRGPAPKQRQVTVSIAAFEAVKLTADSLPPPAPFRSPEHKSPPVVRSPEPAPTPARASSPRVAKVEPTLESVRAPSARPPPLADTSAPTGEGLKGLEPFLRNARNGGGSDLHIVAGRPALLRVAGDLTPQGAAISASVVDRLLLGCVPSHLRASFDELGSCDFAVVLGDLGRFRINIIRQQTGLKATIRLIASTVPTLESLGLPSAIGAATKHHQGLIVVTGPTGHGKTSTMAAIVDILNDGTTAHIITVEDPIEYVHSRKRAVVSQREVGSHTRSFAAALKGSLREDPDVIVVGELRDTETVRMAVAASETGHLVIGTMNTPSAAKTIDRLIDLFPPADQPQVRTSLAAGLRLVVGQRLVPSADHSRMHAAAELLPGSVPLSALIREGKTFQIPSLQQRSKALGIIRLDDSLADLVHAGNITVETARAYAENPNEIDTFIAMRKGGPRPADDAMRASFAKKG